MKENEILKDSIKWNKLSDPEKFTKIEEQIKEQEIELEEIYEYWNDLSDSESINPMSFLGDEKKILDEIEKLKKKKVEFIDHYKKALRFLYDRINDGDTEEHPFLYKKNEMKYYFRLNFENEKTYNLKKNKFFRSKAFLEVAINNKVHGFKRIILEVEDSNLGIKRKTFDILEINIDN